MSGYLSALRERVLLFDGAMGTQLMALHLTDADFGGPSHHGCNEALVLIRPDVIEQIHRDYLAAGADVVETDSFTASRLKLDEYGLGAKTREVNLASAQIARRAADAFSTPQRPRFVAGSLGPTGMLISSSRKAAKASRNAAEGGAPWTSAASVPRRLAICPIASIPKLLDYKGRGSGCRGR